jgi:Lar family restriction alleviation protein
MSTEELKPCPFCGSHAQTDFIEGESYIIECYACDARTGCQDSAEDAINAWNRRSAPAAGTEKPCRNEIINSGAQAWPRTCPRCGKAKDCPAGIVAGAHTKAGKEPT